MTTARVGLGLLAAMLLSASIGGGYRIYELERRELEVVTPPFTLRNAMTGRHSTRVSARLSQVTLRAGERALFELCAQDGLPQAAWLDAFELAVIAVQQNKLLLRVPLDAAHLAHVERSRTWGCLLLGSGKLEASGPHSVEAVWLSKPPPEAVLDVPITVRTAAKSELGSADSALLLGLVCCVLLGLGLALREHTEPVVTMAPAQASRPMIALSALVLLAAASQLPMFGATLTFGKGLLLLALQCGAAWALGRRLGPGDPRSSLGLRRPERPWLAFVAAAAAWPLLVFGAKLALRVVPATGQAPIEAFIAWPSGMLSAALLGVLLPVGEELFFRGLVFGALLPAGRGVAATVSVLSFAALHAQQSWGQWGALLAVTFAGCVFTALRVATGSTLVPAFTHVAYNAALSLSSLGAL